MTLIELKQAILNKEPIQDLIVFVCPENTFLAYQYLAAIEDQYLTEHRTISSLAEIANNSVILDETDRADCLNVLVVDEFKEVWADYSIFKNTVIICKTVSNGIKTELADYITTIDKLTDWQVKDYCSAKCSGLSMEDINWLYNKTNGDIYRIDNELDKVCLYSDNQSQSDIFKLIQADTDLVEFSLFDLEKATILHDLSYVNNCLSHLDSINLDAMALVNILLAHYKKILLLNFNSGLTAADLGIKSGEAYHITRDYISVPYNKVQQAITFLSGIDGRLKNGELELSNTQFINYIITNLL